MHSPHSRKLCRRLVRLAQGAALAVIAQAALAQAPPGAIVQPLGPDAGTELRRHLTTLAANPRSVEALVGAGRAALEMGDVEASVAFFGRAAELAPADARARAGMGAALAHLGRADAAVDLFSQALQLGTPEVEIAADRGLAFDLLGDQARAQQDYALALRQRDDPELRRRMALSLAISGRRDAALAMIDAQLRANDRAGWRVHAFILALTGDVGGARRTAAGVMPVGTAEAMTPFLERLAALSPSQKAQAVHLGRFPSRAASAPVVIASNPEPPAPTPPAAAEPGRRQLAQLDRRRTGRRPVAASSQPTPAPPPPPPPAPPPPPPPSPPPPTESAAMEPMPAAPVPAEPVAAASISAGETVTSGPGLPALTGNSEATPGFQLPPGSSETAPEEFAATPAPPPPPPPASLPAGSPTPAPALADIGTLLESLPDDAAAQASSPPTRAAPPPPERPRAARPAAPAHPRRHWVQLGIGQNRALLANDFRRHLAAAPAQLRGRTPYVARLNATNRLLVGPFASPAEAQRFVNTLSGSGVRAYSWTSDPGEVVERLPARR